MNSGAQRYLVVTGDSGGLRLAAPACGTVTVGSSPRDSVTVNADRVAPGHLRIELDTRVRAYLEGGGGSLLRRRAKTAIPIGRAVELEPGDRLCIASVGVTYAVASAPAPSVARARSGGRSLFISDGLADIVDLIDRVANSHCPVLFVGETGVGKDVLARLLHRRSSRSAGPFVRVNGLDIEAPGRSLLEEAAGGTLAIEEVGGLSARGQLELCRLLDRAEADVERGLEPPRFVASTHRDLLVDAEEGRFRQDLLYRLNAVSIGVPALRQRVQDILPLARWLVEQSASARANPGARISDASGRCLRAYRWPGNTRELKNVIERALLVSTDGVIEPPDLPAEVAAVMEPRSPSSEATQGMLRNELAAFERARVLEAMAEHGTQASAAKALNISVRTLQRRLSRSDAG